MGTPACTPLCLKAVGLELPHMSGSRPQLRLHLHHPEAFCLKAEPQRAALPTPLPRLLPELRRMLAPHKRGQGKHHPLRFHLGPYSRWPFHFYRVKLPHTGLLLPCSSLHHLQLVLWVHLHDPLPYAPIFHLLCSDPVLHPLTHQLLWKTHRRYTLASLWPNYSQVLEETACGCGVRVTVRFDEVLATGPLPDLEEPPCGDWSAGPLGF